MKLPPPPERAGPAERGWLIDPEVTYLNHGSFGARLREVADAAREWRETLEREPVDFLDRRLPALIADAKSAVGAFLGMRADDFGFVRNATEGVNSVLRSLRLAPGDEILATNHVYNAVRQAIRCVTECSGALYREFAVPLPVAAPAQVVERVLAALGARTRLLVVDHVTSPTALVFPVREIVSACRARGIDVLIDGAHAPGMLDLHVESLGAAYYTGNLHKWVCAPPGAAFLWVRPDLQRDIHPAVVSHSFGDGLAREFSWQGTGDPSAWLCAPVAIDAVGRLDRGGWPALRAHNHRRAVRAQSILLDALGTSPCSPRDGSMLGSMAAMPLPEALQARFTTALDLREHLRRHDRIEVPIVDWPGAWLVRVSCHAYNREAEYERLAESLIAASR